MLKAKDSSLIAKIVAAVIVIIGAVLKWLGLFPNCSVQELIAVGFAIMGLFGTVDLNIMLDKVFHTSSNTSTDTASTSTSAPAPEDKAVSEN